MFNCLPAGRISIAARAVPSVASMKKLLWIVVCATVPIWVVVIVRHQSRRPELAQAALKAVAPQRSLKVNAEIVRLERETIEESLAKLSDVNMFHLPALAFSGAGLVVVQSWIPVRKEVGGVDLQVIVSDRRCLKVFEDLGRMDKAAASAMVGRYLSSGIEMYLKLYEAEMRRLAPQFKSEDLKGTGGFSGPTFSIGQVQEGKVVIAGARLNILALVWIAGMLDLSGCKDQVERVAQLAVKQRKELYEDSTLHPFFKAQMLERASLYNRQIICSGLLGVAADGDAQESIVKAVGASWQERQLTSFRAGVTEFDSLALSGAVKPDYSRGSLNVKFVSPLDDAGFDAVLERLHLTSRQ
jgi:hypothetical protein